MGRVAIRRPGSTTWLTDEGGRLVRLQGKTGILRNGCIDFKTCITDRRRPLGDGGYGRQIEAFAAAYCPQLDQVCLVPSEAVPSRCIWPFASFGAPQWPGLEHPLGAGLPA